MFEYILQDCQADITHRDSFGFSPSEIADYDDFIYSFPFTDYLGEGESPVENDIIYRRIEENFDQILNDLSVSNKFNLLIASEYTPRPGFKMNIVKIKKKKEKITIYYEIEKKKSSLITVLSFPFCLLEIEEIENYEIRVKKRRLKFLPVGLF